VSLVITVAGGPTFTFDCAVTADPRMNQGFAGFSGLQVSPQVTFFFETYIRHTLVSLAPHAGLNVTQTKNRAGKIQLMSDKPCSFVRFRWDGASALGWAKGWNPLYSHAEMQGVFVVSSASQSGVTENTALTIYRGDWLYQNGQVINFNTAGGA
jgi:hypothetical protein